MDPDQVEIIFFVQFKVAYGTDNVKHILLPQSSHAIRLIDGIEDVIYCVSLAGIEFPD
jgi:hypothetical protein